MPKTAMSAVRTGRPSALAARADPAKISGHSRKTCPWMDRDQKCCSGLAALLSRA